MKIESFSETQKYRAQEVLFLLIIALSSVVVGILVAEGGLLSNVFLYILLYGLVVGGSLIVTLDKLVFLYVFLVIGLPLHNLRVAELGVLEIAGLSIHVYDILLMVLMGSWLTRLALGKAHFIWGNLYFPLGLFAFWLTVSTFVGVYNGHSRGVILTDLLSFMPYFVLIPVTMSALQQPDKQAKMFMIALVGGTIFNGILTVFANLLGPYHWLSALFPPAALQYRFASSSAPLGLWSFVICAQMLFSISRIHIGWLMFFLASLVLNGYVLIISASRTFWLGTIASLTILVFLNLKAYGLNRFSLAILRFLLVVSVILLVLNILLAGLYNENLQSFKQELGARLRVDFVQDLDPRLEFYRIGWPQLSANPLGSGTGTSWVYMGIIETGLLDNVYLTAALKYGIPGLAILLWFWISPVVRCIRIRRFGRELDIYAKGLLTAITAVIPTVLVLNLNVAHLLYNRQTVVAMAIAMAWIDKMYLSLLGRKPDWSDHSPGLL